MHIGNYAPSRAFIWMQRYREGVINMTDRNYYEILGIGQHADGTAIHRTYWQLARKYQTLAPADPRARLMLDELNDAYGVLGTPALREQYDSSLAHSQDGMIGCGSDQDARPGLRASVSNILRWRPIRRGPAAQTEALAEPLTPARQARRTRSANVDEMRLSTASIVGRWRQNATPDVLRTQRTPDTTLVDIFQSERAIDEPAEPLNAVLDVLRGSRESANSR